MAIVARCLLVLGLLAAFPALAQQEPQQEPPGRVGRVAIISGTLAFYGPGDSEWSAAPVNLPVATGGWFATDPKSRAQLRVGPDTVTLAEDTQLNIADLRDGVMQLALSQGRIGLQLHRPAWRKDQIAEIDIARGWVWLLQPGAYDIDAGAPDRPTRITVFEGSARFAGGGVDKVIKAGERLVLTGADTLTAAVERAEPDDFANWCRDRGIRQDRVAAARRVSPAMTGFEELEEYGEWAEAADYGAVWYPKSVAADWAPYRAGRWVWVEPWGWNWVDDQPWGFAPFHYGRWAQVNERWGWVPGEFVALPVYAPALVAFLPQPALEVMVAADAGPAVGWFPLAPGEVYWPSYTRNPTYIRNVNIANVRINLINQVTTALLTRRGTAGPPPPVLNQRFVNRPAATVVPAQVVVQSAPVASAVVRVPDRELRQIQVAALPPPAVARPAVAAAIAAATMPRHGRQPPAAQPSAGAPTAATQPHLPARPNFAQLARAPRLGHGAAAAIPAALPGAATAPAASPGASPHRPGEAPAATAVIPPLAPRQPSPATNATRPASPGPAGRPDFANLPRWRPHGGPQQAQSGVPTPPNAGLPVPRSADPAARQHPAQELAQQRATAAETARQQQAEQRATRQQEMAARSAQQRTAGEASRQQQVEQRAAQQQATAEQRAAREQARAAQLAQQRAAAEAAGHHQAQQRIAQQQAIAEQRAAREQARAAQLGQQRAAAEAARGQPTEQRAGQQQGIAAQQAQQRAAAEAARQQQAQQRAAQQQAIAAQQAQQRAAQQQAAAQRAAQQQAAQQAAAQRGAQQQAMAAQQAQQRAAQQAAAQQAAAQRAAQQQAMAAQQAAAQQGVAQRAAQQQAMAAQQAQQRAAQQAAAQQAAAQRAAQQQAMAAQQAQQRAAQQAAQQQQKGQQKQAHACGNPGQPACPQH